MHDTGRQEERFAGLDDARRLPVDPHFNLALENVSQLFTGVRVPTGAITRVEFTTDLYGDLAGRGKVLRLQGNAHEARLLRCHESRSQ